MYVPVVTHIPACCPCSSRFFTISYFSQRGICNPDFPSKRTGLPCPASLDLTFFFLLFVCLGSLAPLWQGPSFNHDQILPVHTCVWTSNALLSLGPQSANANFLSLPTCCWRRRKEAAQRSPGPHLVIRVPSPALRGGKLKSEELPTRDILENKHY